MSNDDLSQHENAVSSNEVVVVEKKQRPKIKRREVVNGKPKLGRPKKSDIEKKKKPGLIGRPPGSGDGARIAEFKARLLATSGDSIINKVVEIALTDGHPSQSAALKMCVDRVLPMSYFDKDKQSGSIPQISINISGLTSPTVEASEIIENDFTDVIIKDVE